MINYPTDPVAAMREACAKVAEGLAGANTYKAMICDEIAAAIRATPIPIPAAQPDPRDEAREIWRCGLELPFTARSLSFARYLAPPPYSP